MDIKEIIQRLIIKVTGLPAGDFQIEKPKGEFGDYAVNAAFIIAKKEGKSSAEIAGKIVEKINKIKPEEIEKVEAVSGYVNFFLSKKYLWKTLSEIAEKKDYGTNKVMAGKIVMVEYTDANPFKLFHIGHLMSNFIGETIARLYEANGAKVIRANYQGDAGLHVAMTVWAMKKSAGELPTSASSPKKVEFLGKCYAAGSKAYRNEIEPNPEKIEIEKINDLIYSKADPEINHLYDLGRKWSLEYFEKIYKKLGTKFDEYFFESQTGKDGLEFVQNNKKVFQDSDGAVVFRGEEYGLHTRVFVNKNGLPTYEAKELGLNKKKFELYPLDLSIIVTGNEINDYFRVLLKVMELTIPDVARKTSHIGHGMLRLPTGKMSSRTGQVVTAEWLIEEVESKLKEKAPTPRGVGVPTESIGKREFNLEPMAIGAIKYSILKQSPGRDVIFDFSKSLSLEGDSGPYLQYTYARLNSILEKKPHNFDSASVKFETLDEKSEINIMRHLIDFPEIVGESCRNIAPNHLVSYLYQLANLANSFYEKVRILTDDNKNRLCARLVLVKTVAETLKNGLQLLGIKSLPKI